MGRQRRRLFPVLLCSVTLRIRRLPHQNSQVRNCTRLPRTAPIPSIEKMSSQPLAGDDGEDAEKMSPQYGPFLNYHSVTSMTTWVVDVEEMDGVRPVPPLDIIHFPDLMDRAWGRLRVVPWRAGYVYWDAEYFLATAGEHNLQLAAKQCLEVEHYIMTHLHLNDEEKSLSQKIMDRANGMIGSEGVSAITAAGLVCIMEEAKLMSELSASDTDMFVFSNKVRCRAFDLMTYNGSDSTAGAGAMLGMAVEARRVRDYLDPEDNPSRFEEKDTSQIVREKTLHCMALLQSYFARKTALNSDVNAAPANAITGKPTWELNDNESDASESINQCSEEVTKKEKRKCMEETEVES